MAEPTDVMMPILQRIQCDVAEVKRVQTDHGKRLDTIAGILTEHSERLSEMNGYLSFGLSITSRLSKETEDVRSEIDAIKRRLARLEANA